jgi:hypothetical protein
LLSFCSSCCSSASSKMVPFALPLPRLLLQILLPPPLGIFPPVETVATAWVSVFPDSFPDSYCLWPPFSVQLVAYYCDHERINIWKPRGCNRVRTRRLVLIESRTVALILGYINQPFSAPFRVLNLRYSIVRREDPIT